MPDRHLLILLGAIALLLAPFLWLAQHAPVMPPSSLAQGQARLPPEAPPNPEPLVFAPIPQDAARKANAAIPFARDRGPAAAPFVLTGDPASQARATDCLAAAMLYEAGDDDRGQRAVAQVVLNRMRHPAYPASVCAVVFQGSERRTGCQFTFTCDGALARTPSPGAFDRAQARARAMLAGSVFAEVGLATHYHTDWVHPVWSAELDKIAQIDTHLFFRWHGGWGTRRAFVQRYAGGEVGIPQLAALSPVHGASLTPEALAAASEGTLPSLADPALARAEAALITSASARKAAARGTFVIDLAPGGNGTVQAMMALPTCGEREVCKVIGRLNASAPAELRSRVAFIHLRDRRTGMLKTYWNCEIYRRNMASQCLGPESRQWLTWEAPAEAQPRPVATTAKSSLPSPERSPRPAG
jgi:spore germination cell wall hydrolase CwlJ-like protein